MIKVIDFGQLALSLTGIKDHANHVLSEADETALVLAWCVFNDAVYHEIEGVSLERGIEEGKARAAALGRSCVVVEKVF